MVSLRNFSNESHPWMNEWMLDQIIHRQRREAILLEQMQPALFQRQIILAASLEMSLLSQWELCSNKRGMQDLIMFTGM